MASARTAMVVRRVTPMVTAFSTTRRFHTQAVKFPLPARARTTCASRLPTATSKYA